MRAVNLGFVAVSESRFPSRAEVQSGIPFVVDLYFGAVLEILVGAFGTDEHRSFARTRKRSILDFPMASLFTNLLPSIECLAVEKRYPSRILCGSRGCHCQRKTK